MLNNIIINYFSGTGNAKSVAEWIADEAEKQDIPVRLNFISSSSGKTSACEGGTLIGFISPTHGFNYSPLMIHYILRFPISKNKNKVFLMNTRAGFKIGNLFMPGLSGIALLLPALVLLIKGYKITGMRSIDLPSNWISVHPSLSPKVVSSIYNNCELKTRRFAKHILSGKKSYRALLDLPFDIAVSPIAVLYYIIGRFQLAKTFIATSSCNNCDLCMKQCPVKAISVVNGRMFWSYKCESCMKCMNNCPQRAIETAHGFFIGIMFLISFLTASFYELPFIKEISFAENSTWWIGTIKWIVNNAIVMLLLFTGYRILHYLRRIRLVDLLFTYTSLTKYSFWKRYNPKKYI